MPDFSKVKLLVIDMDNTLCDTFHTLSKRQWGKAAAVLEQHGLAKEAKVFSRNLGKKSFKRTIEDLKLPAAVRDEMMVAYDGVAVKLLKPYPDAQDILRLPHEKVLVTRGEKQLQIRKIKHLGIAKHFRKIYYVPTMQKKEAAFRQVLKDFAVQPSACLVIGDRVEEEIIEGRRLGMRTALVDRPDWPTQRIVKPDVTAKSLTKIAAILRHV